MGAFGPNVCDRCVTTHPQDDHGARPCPKPPTPVADRSNENPFASIGIGANAFPTRGYGRSKHAPAYGGNPGHHAPTGADLGLNARELDSIGIR